MNKVASKNLPLEEIPGGEEIDGNDGPEPGADAMYEDIGNPSRPVQEEGAKNKGDYTQLSTRKKPVYESLHRGETAESQAAEQRYEPIPGYENFSMNDASRA